VVAGACTKSPAPAPANATPPAPAVTEIPAAADQPVTGREKRGGIAKIDLDAIVERGYVRILVAPSRAHFQTVDGRHRGRAVDTGVALAGKLAEDAKRDVTPVFIETPEDQLIPSLLAGKGDVAANVLLSFARDEQVAFAPPIKTGIRELVVTDVGARLVSLEDVGGRTIQVRKNSDHHASLLRLNEQLKKINRPPATIVVDEKTLTDEDLLDGVNAGRIRATVVDEYIFDFWQKQFPKIANINRDVAVSQDGSLSWVTRKDAPQLIRFMKEFFSTHRLTF
jgi:membrane-bound lytic murein transglycosylase MltF